MGIRRRRVAWIAALPFVLAACGDIAISLDPRQLPGVVVLPDADRVSLDVVSRDARTQFNDRVGTLRRSGKKIVANNDAADLVRGAVERVLKDQGFVVAAGGLVVTAELQNFYFDADFGTVSSVTFTLRVRDPSGRTLYSHHYEGKAKGGMLASFGVAEKAKRELEEALDDAVSKVSADTALQQALLSPRPSPSPTAPAKGRT